MRLRQLAFAVNDLAKGCGDVESVLGLSLAYRDPAVARFDLENAVFPLGESDFLELVSPLREAASASRYLARRGGDTGYMVIVECEDARQWKPRIAAAGVRIVFELESDSHTSYHLHPSDCGGVLLSIDSARDWQAAGPTWRDHVRTQQTQGFAGLQIGCEEPGRTSELWAQLLGVPERRNSLQLENAAIGFVPSRGARGAGIESVALQVSDPQHIRQEAEARGCLENGMVTLCGTRIDFAG